MFKITNIKLLKIIKYLIVKQGYKPIVANTRDEEVFLESIGRKDFEIICLVDRQYIDKDAFLLDVKRIQSLVNRIKTKLFKYKLKTTIIFVNDNMFCNDGEIISDIKIYKMTKDNFNSPELLDSFPDLNENIAFSEEGLSKDEEFTKIMNDISFYSKQKYESIKTKRRIINFNAHKFIIGLILIYNIVVFKFLPGSIFISTEKGIQFLNLFGASSFEMTFVNGQYWRPLAAGFLEYSTIALLVNIWIFYSYGNAIWNMLGNRGYLATIVIGSYITYFATSLFLPGWIFFGTGHLKALTLGAFISSYVLKRIEYIKFYKYYAFANAFVFSIIFLLSNNLAGRASMFIGVVIGFLVSFIIVSIKDKNWFDVSTSSFTIASILLFGITSWSRLPVKYNAYNELNSDFYSAYDNINPDYSRNIKDNICNYYNKTYQNCKIR